MHLDVTELRDFYQRPLGQLVRRLLLHRIRARWRHMERKTVMGLGFPAPFLGAFRGEVGRLGALMPMEQGALAWPKDGARLAVLVEEEHLPLADNAVDFLLAVHCLEVAERPRPLLREMWRVLTPEGRLLMIVPNRRSVWARLDTTPFGQGRPYSRGQLQRLLSDALFTPLEWANALHVPPIERRVVLRSATLFERIGARLSLGFGGVIIVEARKEVAALIGKPAKARRRPGLVPVPGGGAPARAPPSAI